LKHWHFPSCIPFCGRKWIPKMYLGRCIPFNIPVISGTVHLFIPCMDHDGSSLIEAVDKF
jgi:hypothetical protein